jgi:aspartyl/asparaginyl-tRNA synthetase
MQRIDYSLLGEAVEYYTARGFKYIEVPWIVSKEADYATKPDTARAFECILVGKSNHYSVGDFVASAEQSFLQMMFDGDLPKGKYCAVTPCFRDDEPDEIHLRNFMKLELIDTQDVDIESMWRMMRCARYFFEKYVNTRIEPINEIQFDIVTQGHNIELGSYGLRSHTRKVLDAQFKYDWVYGTGIALPRFNIAWDKEIFEGV